MNKKKFLMGLIGLCAIAAFSSSLFFERGKTKKSKRINGFNLVAPSKPFTVDSLKNVKQASADWVAIVPYAFCNAETAEITFDHPRQWWGEKPEGVKETIAMAKSLGLKVMLKPHLWVGGQGWAGDLDFESDSLWQVFEQQYAEYIDAYGKIADSMDIELYCIGTEVRNSTRNRKSFWLNLIADTRNNFSGQLTYAANWDEYDQITFWDKLDYIGVDAYFPLSEAKSPSKQELLDAWEQPKKEMQRLSEKFQKQVLFTEFGYESIDYNTMGHWKLSKDSLSVNLENQKVAFEALFNSFNSVDWWKGGFIWKWHLNRNELNSRNIKAYTPQNKPALKVIENKFKIDL
ncbi:MAG: glycoside hydrolase family 113 [Bacteroidota bacterium]